MYKPSSAPLLYTSKAIDWSDGGRGEAVFDSSFIPNVGPTGGIVVIDRIALHARLTVTVADAALAGEDVYRAIRNVTLLQVDGEKRFDQISGDSLRDISYAQLGASATHEHQDVAIGAGTTIEVTACLPLAKPFAFADDDTSLPAYLMRELKLGMAQNTDMSVGGATVTVTAGSYWVIAECREEHGVVHHSLDCWTERAFDTSDSGTIAVNGRPQDLYLTVRGANGGASLADLREVFIPTVNIYASPLLKSPDLQQYYARARHVATNAFATKGNPLTTDPFVAARTGTLRAVAALLVNGHKVWEAPEVKNLLVKTTLDNPLALRILCRATKRKTAAMRDLIMSTHKVSQSYLKTHGKTARNYRDWDPAEAAYLPEKFIRVANGRSVPFAFFEGAKPV